MMSRILLTVFFCHIAASGFSQPDSLLIPEPVKITRNEGHLGINEQTRILTDNDTLEQIAILFAEQMNPIVGKNLKTEKAGAKRGNITLKLNEVADAEIGSEGYRLYVRPSGICVYSNRPAGIFYGLQSLGQMMELAAAKTGKQEMIRLPAVSVVDYPRFGWRGLMLDVSRHFFPKKFILGYLDQMATYKFNVFHWHLTDDPGWRMEIKRYPELTTVGAWSVPRTGMFYSMPAPQPGEKATYGGYYSQDDIREIVAYAASRQITVVPEIDIPGHSRAFLAAYPQASCSGKPISVYAGEAGGPGENVLCAGNENNFQMLDHILDEVVTLFPGKYIHIGGDEVNKEFWKNCPKCQQTMRESGLKDEHELQSYFIKKVGKMIESKGKKLIGWDEILEGGLAPNATVMSWRGMDGGIKAATEGHEVIMTPISHCYLDYMQGDPAIEGMPASWSIIRLSQSYDFEPVPDGVDEKYILGGQGNVWTEMISSERRVEYMTWPRAIALSEVFWSPKHKRSWSSFFSRLENHFDLLENKVINYSRSVFDPDILPVRDESGEMKVSFRTELPNLKVYYTFDFSFPDQFSDNYQGQPVGIPAGASVIQAVAYSGGKQVSRVLRMSVDELRSRMP